MSPYYAFDFQTRFWLQVPKITTDLGKELYFVKLPNFLSVDCKPFDPETYEDEIEDDTEHDEEGKQSSLRIFMLIQ